MAEKLTDDQIEAIAVDAMRGALGGPEGEVGQARLRNIRAYNAEPVGEFAPPEIADRSDFVDTTVRDTVNGMLPQLMRMFISSDNAVEFESRGGTPEADAEAKLATAYVNHLFYVRNDGVGILSDWFKDALLQKVGFVKVEVEDEAEDAKQAYEGQSPEQLMMLLQDGWEIDGDPEQADDGSLSFVVVKRGRARKVCVAACAPHSMRIDPNARWGGEPAMIGQVHWKPKFELEAEGFDLSDVPSEEFGPTDIESLELIGENDFLTRTLPHESHRLVRLDELYIKLDRDGDGVAEWLRVCLLGDTLAKYTDGKTCIEQVDDHPYVWICPTPRSHSFYGDCPADYAYPAQKLRTSVVRAMDDNLLQSVNVRTYVNINADVNIDDVLDSRPGGVIRGGQPYNVALAPIVQPNMLAPAYQFNEYIGSWAENATGFNRYSAGTDQNALNKTARGTELLTAKADMRMELIARYFAVGVRNMFAKMLKLAIQYQNADEMVKVNGQFVPINPTEFRNQFDLKINVGLGNGSKEQQMQRLMGMAQMIGSMGVQAGVVSPQNIAEIIKLGFELNEFKNPDRFVQSQPTGMPPNPQAYQQEKAQVQGQMQHMGQQLQQLQQENMGLKAQAAAKEAEIGVRHRELDIKSQELQQKALEAQHGLALKDRQQGFAEATATQDDVVAQLQGTVGQLVQAVQFLMQRESQEASQGMDAPAAPIEGIQ